MTLPKKLSISFSWPNVLFGLLLTVYIFQFDREFLKDTPLFFALTAAKNDPSSPAVHLRLAELYHRLGTKLVENEVRLVSDWTATQPAVNVLGNSTNLSKKYLQIEQDYQAYRNIYAHWQEVLKQYPDYRDALEILWRLSRYLGDHEQTQIYLSQLKSIDPNYIEKVNDLKYSLHN